MRIKKLKINGFGKFQGFEIAFDGNFVLIAGKNEAGKSTMASAITAVLFGSSKQRKDFFRRFKPWGSSSVFQASMLIEAGDGKEYLIGRDFTTGRTEVFRCDGLRLEAMNERFLNELVENEVGITNPLLFEHTLFIREKEMSLFDSSPKFRGSLSEVLNKMLAGSGPTVPLNEAILWLEENLQRFNSGEPLYNSGVSLRDETVALRKELEKVEKDYWYCLQLKNELQNIEITLAKQKEKMELAQSVSGNKSEKSLEHRLTQLTEQITLLEGEYQRLYKIQEQMDKCKTEVPRETLTRENIARCETIITRLSAIEIEEKIRLEQVEETNKQIEVMEKEADVLRQKLQGLSDWDDPDRQSQIEECLTKISNGQKQLIDQSKRILSQEGKIRRYKMLRDILLLTAVLGGIGVVVAGYFLHLFLTGWMLLFIGGETLLLVGSMISTALLTQKKRWSAREEEYYNQVEEEFQGVQLTLKQLLKGKTIEEYQSEGQRVRLYQSDLWQLEKTIEVYNKIEKGGEVTALREEAAALTSELAELLETYRKDPTESWTLILKRQRDLANDQSEGTVQIRPDQKRWREDDLNKLQEEIAQLKIEENSLRHQLREENEAFTEQNYCQIQREYKELQMEKVRKETEYELLRLFPGTPWELSNQLEEKKRQLAKFEEENKAIRLTIELLKAAGEAATGNVQDIQLYAGEYLARITQGRYSKVLLKMEKGDLSILVQAPESEELIDPNLLSAGSMDQVYFAFRLALARVIAKAPGFPILLDDAFPHFDQDRLGGAVELLKDLSKTHQIIWWTKDPGLTSELVGIDPIYLE